MDNQRLILWAIFLVLAWMTYQQWQADYAPKPVPTETAVDAGDTTELPPVDTSLPDLDSAPTGDIDAPALSSDELPTVAEETPAASTIRVVTDVLDVTISTEGGTLVGATLLEYPVAKDQPDTLVNLLGTTGRDMMVVQSGVRAAGGRSEANHRTVFNSAKQNFDMGGDDELIVPLVWESADGISVIKQFRFARGSYAIGVSQSVSNSSDAVWRGAEYMQLQRYLGEQERSMFDVDSYSFDGPMYFDDGDAEKLDADDLEDESITFETQRGWLASIQHHFVTAMVPPLDQTQSFSISMNGTTARASTIGKVHAVEPGSSHEFNTTLFVGPKLQSQLAAIDDSMLVAVDYGFLRLLSEPLFWLLSKAYDFVGNWGVAIILVTLLIKLVFYKLTESSGRSMAKMRTLQPRMKAIQDRHKDDRQAQSQAMMDLYKREKVNPAAGCLPILIQMPFFLAFYWVLLESVEMRQAPFALWITDLSVRDPFFILPLIMGAAMFFQQKLNPQVGDPIQQKVMQLMPIIFTGLFAFFPSGLVLYWVTNTVLSIAQQWKINKVVEAEGKQTPPHKQKSD
ncbi:MAG: membrane protein insertase YidC [Pseudomonadota bacterium]